MFWLVSILSLILPPLASTGPATRELTFEQRVAAQVALDRIASSHRSGAAQAPDEVAAEDLAHRRVRTWMLQEAALSRFVGTRITVGQLDEELDRIMAHTAMPGRLGELLTALDNDRFLAREILARPLLADRLLRLHYASDETRHAAARREAETLASDLFEGRISVAAPHPRRHLLTSDPVTREPVNVADRRPRSVRVEDALDAFLVTAQAEDAAGNPAGLVYRFPKGPFEEWWRDAQTRLTDPPMPAALAGGESAPVVQPCVQDNVWTPTSKVLAPSPLTNHVAVWTGTTMIVAGASGGLYDPVTDSWRPMSGAGSGGGTSDIVAVWTGEEMLVWGGGSGSRYDPVNDTWTPMSSVGDPAPRAGHAAVWTGSRMIVWGGQVNLDDESTGGIYDPLADVWSPTSLQGAPSPREGHTATWTGNRMVVWGGVCRAFRSGFCNGEFLDSGALYDPATDSWTPTSMTDVPRTRTEHTAVWNGQHVLIWGGSGPFVWQRVARFDPVANQWLPLASTADEPEPRASHMAVWTGERMIVWGGRSGLTRWVTGGRFDPVALRWSATSLVKVPTGRDDATMVWADGVAIVFGGLALPELVPSNDGGRLSLSTLPDGDRDGWGVPCDCDDADSSTYPGAPDRCDGVNNDCTHPGWPDTTGVDRTDADGDFWPVCAGDCNDSRSSVFPGADEVCDGVDTNCDGTLPSDENDVDDDDWIPCTGDCSEGDNTVFPGAPEECDGLDNDCDGIVPADELDADHDGSTTCAGDCSDLDPAVHPGAVELPGNLRDENCDGQVLCDPTATWQSQGDFLTCVTRSVNDLVKAGLITREEGTQLIRRSTRLAPG